MHINYSWNFHQNIFTLTIYFIVLNAVIEFVLIYRPHPVIASDLDVRDHATMDDILGRCQIL